LSVVDNGKHQTYSLLGGDADLKPGMRVELRGKKSKDSAGTRTFQAQKLVKSLGACSVGQSAADTTHSPSD
jgi:hypothetical protein